MKRINSNELKEIQLDMLKRFDLYCRDNKITYYLAFGTLIGAIRHKGYIPWDDDIDIMIPRKDYNKLIKLYNKDRTNSNLKIISHITDKGYYLPFAKLINTSTIVKENVEVNYELGVYLDLFPIDYMTNSLEKARQILKKSYQYCMKLQFKTITWSKKRNIVKNIVLMIGKMFLSVQSIDSILNRFDKYCQQNIAYDNSKYIGILPGLESSSDNNIYIKEWFNETVEVEFEGGHCPAPSGYNDLLRSIYGDYMQLPPKDKQVTHHSFEAWYKS